MCVNWKIAFKTLGLAGLLFLGAARLGAQTPVATPVADDAAADASDSAQRVRISDNIGFYYFVSAGYVTQDASKIPALGKITGDFTDQSTFSARRRKFMSNFPNAIVKPGGFFSGILSR